MPVPMIHEGPITEPVLQTSHESRYGIEVNGAFRSRVVRALYRLGCDLVDQSAPGYVLVTLNEAQRELVRTWNGVHRVFEVPGAAKACAETDLVSDAAKENTLVEITSGSCATLRGLLRVRQGDKVDVEVFCFGRAMVVTVPAESVVPVPLPEAWQ